MTPERKELIREGESHERILSNGHRGDPGAMSDALGYLIRVTRTQLNAETVTPDECTRRMKACPNGKPRFGWPAFSAVFTVVVAVLTLILKFT